MGNIMNIYISNTSLPRHVFNIKTSNKKDNETTAIYVTESLTDILREPIDDGEDGSHVLRIFRDLS